MPRDEDLKLLALVMWREARGEATDGLRAVAHVIRNRVLAWHQSWQQIIMAKNQFSSMSATGDPQLNLYPNYQSPAYAQIARIAERIYDGTDEDLTHGALYYWNPRTATSKWFKQHIADVMEKVAVIGNHEFFRPAGGPPVSG